MKRNFLLYTGRAQTKYMKREVSGGKIHLRVATDRGGRSQTFGHLVLGDCHRISPRALKPKPRWRSLSHAGDLDGPLYCWHPRHGKAEPFALLLRKIASECCKTLTIQPNGGIYEPPYFNNGCNAHLKLGKSRSGTSVEFHDLCPYNSSIVEVSLSFFNRQTHTFFPVRHS